MDYQGLLALLSALQPGHELAMFELERVERFPERLSGATITPVSSRPTHPAHMWQGGSSAPPDLLGTPDASGTQEARFVVTLTYGALSYKVMSNMPPRALLDLARSQAQRLAQRLMHRLLEQQGGEGL